MINKCLYLFLEYLMRFLRSIERKCSLFIFFCNFLVIKSRIGAEVVGMRFRIWFGGLDYITPHVGLTVDLQAECALLSCTGGCSYVNYFRQKVLI